MFQRNESSVQKIFWTRKTGLCELLKKTPKLLFAKLLTQLVRSKVLQYLKNTTLRNITQNV